MNKRELACVVLRELKVNSNLSQRELAKLTNLSIGSVNNIISEAKRDQYIDNENQLTDKSERFLEKFAVKNAIILAAGFGSRMAPLTLQRPKGLLKVKGVPMIERIITQLHEKGIKEIIVVTGYLCRNFDYLAGKYGVKIVFNADYKSNNIYSVACVAEHISSTYIICQDNWIENNIFNAYEPRSWYSCQFFSGHTKEWCVTKGHHKLIRDISIGGKDAFGLYGPTYFTADFSKVFKERLKEYLALPAAKDYFWEDVWIKHIKELPMYVNDQTNNVFEFDSIEELGRFDESYKEIPKRNEADNEKIMKNIDGLIDAFGYDKVAILLSEDGQSEKIKEAATNMAYRITWNGMTQVLRFAGSGTEVFIDRDREQFYTEQATEMGGITPKAVFYNNGRIKITEYVENAETFDIEKHDLKKLVDLMNAFYKVEKGTVRCLKSEIERYESLYAKGFVLPDEYDFVKGQVLAVKYIPETAHGDLLPFNILVQGDKYYLIDFEYSGVLSRYWDYGNFVSEVEHFQNTPRDSVTSRLVEVDSTLCPHQILVWSYVVDFVWGCWGFARQGFNEESVAYGMPRYEKAKKFFMEVKDGKEL